MRTQLKIFLVVLAASLLNINPLQAHEPDHTYIYLRIYEQNIEGRFEITVQDINRELGLNLSEENITQAEVDPYIPQIQELLLRNTSFGAAGTAYPIQFTEATALALDDEEDYVKFNFELGNMTLLPENLDITYGPFMENNSNHKGMLIIEHNWEAGIIDNYSLVAEVFSKGDVSKQLSLTEASILRGFWAMIKLGMWHIWIGLDHILFLVALILPGVVRRIRKEGVAHNSMQEWTPVEKFKPAFLYILKIITFFTLAHSITLAIASLGILKLPIDYVEATIAFSIAMAAFHNIRPIFGKKEWLVAFAFGLFHGFGFASVLGEKGLGGEYLVLSLLGFNVGVEFGQLLIIAGIFPILFLIRNFGFYPKLLTYGSVALILISLNWTVERLFGFNIPLGRWADSLLALLF